jgi:hypothetical protein
MAQEDILLYISRIMHEKGLHNYRVNKKLISIYPQSPTVIANENDIYFLANYFTDFNSPAGKIIAENNGLQLNSKNLNTTVYRQQYFTGTIVITNNESAGRIGDPVPYLNCEFYIVSPIYELNAA